MGAFAVVALLAALLAAVWDWNWFRGPLAGMASARLHRPVSISGDLRVRLWSWEPSATVDGIRIGNPAWAGPGDVARIDRIAAQVRLLPLFRGQVDMPLLEVDRPDLRLYRDAGGRATWDFSDGKAPDAPLRLPPIRRFIINGGRLEVRDDDRKLHFTGAIEARETLGETNRGFHVDGEGTLNAQPFQLRVTGGPLLNIDRKKPYPFDADVRAGQTFVTARGAVPKPFDLSNFWMDVTSRGPDLSQLYGLTGVPLPNTPPYSLRGRLTRANHLWRIDGIGGRLGSSDLGGWLTIDGSRKPAYLKADLRSRRLVFPDAGALFGGAAKTGAVASPAQVAVARQMKAEARIFPTATLNFDRIRKLDADVSYQADSIAQAPVNLRAATVHVKLRAGLLRAEPLQVDLPQGRVNGWVQLDGRQHDAITDLDLRLSNARLESLVPLKFQGAPPVTGAILGRVKLHGVGDSVHDALADANGQMTLVVPGGEIRRSLAELAGVDLIKGLGLLYSGSQETTPLRCAVAHFEAKGGVMSADRLVVDTGPVLIQGSGVINLDRETFAIHARGRPKRFQLVRLLAPVTVSGPWLHPQVSVQKGQAIAQGAGAVVLGAVLSPLAVILPFVDPGLAKNADCQALLAQGQAGAEPAPRPTRVR